VEREWNRRSLRVREAANEEPSAEAAEKNAGNEAAHGVSEQCDGGAVAAYTRLTVGCRRNQRMKLEY
jgi:hypothetical protein